jgi:hypothetical protein
MSSFKNLNRSDVSVVPYEANKQWSFSYCPYPTSSQHLTIYKGTNVPGVFSSDTDPVTEGQYERLVYNQINHLFYQKYTASLNTSSLANSIYYESASQQRPTASYFIYNDKPQLVKNFPTGANEGIRVITANQSTYGNKILPYTFILSSSAYLIADDGFGNLLTLQGLGESYIENGYFDAIGYFADNVINANSYIGNIFYAQGIAVITDQSFQTMFPLPPLAVNDTVSFLTTDSPKTVSPLTNDDGRGGTIDDTTLTLSGSASELALWTNNGDGTITLSTTTAGVYTIYYTVEASYDCGNITSNKGKITTIVTAPTTTTTTSTTTTTTTAAPTTTTTTSTTTTTTTPTPATINWVNIELGSPYIDSNLFIDDDATNVVSSFLTETGNFTAGAGSSIYSQQDSQTGTIGNYRLYIENTTDAIVLYDNTSTPGSIPSTVNSYTFTAASNKTYSISASVSEIIPSTTTTTTAAPTTTTTTAAPTTTTTTAAPTTTTTTTAAPTTTTTTSTTTTTTTLVALCENWEIINGASANVIDYQDCLGNPQQLNLLAEEIIGCFSVNSNAFGTDIPFLGTQPFTSNKCVPTTTTTSTTTISTTTAAPTTTTTTTTAAPTTTTTSTTTTTTTIACFEYVATADQTDIDASDDGNVYFNYTDCDGNPQILSRGTTTPSNPVCAQNVGSVYILVGGNQSVAGSSLWSVPGSQCNQSPTTTTTTAAPTTTTTTAAPTTTTTTAAPTTTTTTAAPTTTTTTAAPTTTTTSTTTTTTTAAPTTTTTTSTTTTTTTTPVYSYCTGYDATDCCIAQSDYITNCGGSPF